MLDLMSYTIPTMAPSTNVSCSPSRTRGGGSLAWWNGDAFSWDTGEYVVHQGVLEKSEPTFQSVFLKKTKTLLR
jgi:hypothetical protein